MPFVSPNAGEGGSMVVAVKKHPQKCMAYVAFVAPQFAQAILSSPPQIMCGVPVLPARQHATDPNSIVVKWADGAMIEEQDIAAEFDAIFAGMGNGMGSGMGGGKGGWMGGGGGGVDGGWGGGKGGCGMDGGWGGGKGGGAMDGGWGKGSGGMDGGWGGGKAGWGGGKAGGGMDGGWGGKGGGMDGSWGGGTDGSWGGGMGGMGGMGGGGFNAASASSGKRQFVEGVKKHPNKPMANVTFKLEEVTQAALMEASTCTSLGQVPLDPLAPHEEDPRTIVLQWQGDGSALSVETIADFYESFMLELFGAAGGESQQGGQNRQQSAQQQPQQQVWGGCGGDEGGVEVTLESIAAGLDWSKPLVCALKKHPTKTMAYVTFQSVELAQVALQDPDPPRRIGPAAIQPIIPHNNDPYSVVVYWHPGYELGPEDVAGHFELRLNTLLGAAGPSQSSSPGLDEMKMAIGLEAGQPFIARVKTSPPKKTAFITFQTPDIAQAVMQERGAISKIGHVKVDPLEPHRSDPSTVVMFWKTAPDLHPGMIQQSFEARCAELLAVSMGQPGGAASQGSGMAPWGNGGCGGGCSGKGYGGGGGMPGMMRQGMGCMGGKSQAGQPYTSPEGLTVRKHGTQPMAYIMFPSEELAQALLASPPTSLCGMKVLPARPHNKDPKGICIRWNGPPHLPEPAIAAGIAECIAPLLQAAGACGGESGDPTAALGMAAGQEAFAALDDESRKRSAEESAEGSDGAAKRFREMPLE